MRLVNPVDADRTSVAEKGQFLVVDFCELLKLYEIHAPLAEFAFRNERVSFSQSFRHVHLSESGLLASLNQSSEKVLVGVLVGLVAGIHPQCILNR